MRNIEKYLNNLTEGQECMVYKIDPDEFDCCNDDTIVYIGDYQLQELTDAFDNEGDLTDEEIIRLGLGETKRTIRESIKSHFDVDDEYIDRHGLIKFIWQECDWAYVETVVLDLTEHWDFENGEFF